LKQSKKVSYIALKNVQEKKGFLKIILLMFIDKVGLNLEKLGI